MTTKKIRTRKKKKRKKSQETKQQSAFPLGRTTSLSYLDDDVALPCSGPIQFSVLLHHYNLSFLLNFLHVLFYLVQNTAVILLGDADKLG